MTSIRPRPSIKLNYIIHLKCSPSRDVPNPIIVMLPRLCYNLFTFVLVLLIVIVIATLYEASKLVLVHFLANVWINFINFYARARCSAFRFYFVLCVYVQIGLI